MSLAGYCTFLLRQEPEERYRLLWLVMCSDVFPPAMRMLPNRIWGEFMWFEKRISLEESLQHEVSPEAIQEQIDKGMTDLSTLVQQWKPGDTYGYYHALPGDTGYALIREGRVVAYYTFDIISF